LQNNIKNLKSLKEKNNRFSVIAAYDATMTLAINQAEIEVILVGDSLGMLVQGHENTLPVTLDQMVYHTEAVCRANRSSEQQALIISDLPFMSYNNEEKAIRSAEKLVRAGANMVKLEGGSWLSPIIKKLTLLGIPVCGHIGLTPQSVNKFGGFKVQGKHEIQKKELIDDAKELELAGADFIVLECIPAELAKSITSSLSCSTIGIGAGKHTDAQVLVCYDILGLNKNPPRFVKNFLSDSILDIKFGPSTKIKNFNISDIFSSFKKYVVEGKYPSDEHSY
jgi:3-methyl-2-oxobutanoate hydroxymethyltransferase